MTASPNFPEPALGSHSGTGETPGRDMRSAGAPFPPTARQLELLRYIAGYQEAHGGVSPTFTEMRAGVSRASKSNLTLMLHGLEDRGLIRRIPGRARAIEVLSAPPIPRAPDGAPLFFIPVSRLPIHHEGSDD